MILNRQRIRLEPCEDRHGIRPHNKLADRVSGDLGQLRSSKCCTQFQTGDRLLLLRAISMLPLGCSVLRYRAIGLLRGVAEHMDVPQESRGVHVWAGVSTWQGYLLQIWKFSLPLFPGED